MRVDQNSSEDHTNQAASGAKVPGSSGKGKKVVSFAPGVKPPADGEASKTAKLGSDAVKEGAEAILSPPPLDGIIGRLEIRKSGAVQMRLGDGILLDVRRNHFLGALESGSLSPRRAGKCCDSAVFLTACDPSRPGEEATKCTWGSQPQIHRLPQHRGAA